MQSVDTNTVVTHLKSAAWHTLLQRVGSGVMTHLLHCTCVFVSLPNCCFLQVAGPPVSEYKHLLAPVVSTVSLPKSVAAGKSSGSASNVVPVRSPNRPNLKRSRSDIATEATVAVLASDSRAAKRRRHKGAQLSLWRSTSSHQAQQGPSTTGAPISSTAGSNGFNLHARPSHTRSNAQQRNSRKLAHDRILYCSTTPGAPDARFTCFPPNRTSCLTAMHVIWARPTAVIHLLFAGWIVVQTCCTDSSQPSAVRGSCCSPFSLHKRPVVNRLRSS